MVLTYTYIHRLAVVSKKEAGAPHHPLLPCDAIFEKGEQFRKFLLTKSTILPQNTHTHTEREREREREDRHRAEGIC